MSRGVPRWFQSLIYILNPVCPSDTIWWHRSRSKLSQVMACCLTAPSHYLKHCWLLISKALWHSPESNCTVPKLLSCIMSLQIITFPNIVISPLSYLCHCCAVLRADSRFACSQWETALLCNDVSHWLGASLESALVLLLICISTILMMRLYNIVFWLKNFMIYFMGDKIIKLHLLV